VEVEKLDADRFAANHIVYEAVQGLLALLLVSACEIDQIAAVRYYVSGREVVRSRQLLKISCSLRQKWH
jgi:hypothetical protein